MILFILFLMIGYSCGTLGIYRSMEIDQRSTKNERNFAYMASIFWLITVLVTITQIIIEAIKDRNS